MYFKGRLREADPYLFCKYQKIEVPHVIVLHIQFYSLNLKLVKMS